MRRIGFLVTFIAAAILSSGCAIAILTRAAHLGVVNDTGASVAVLVNGREVAFLERNGDSWSSNFAVGYGYSRQVSVVAKVVRAGSVVEGLTYPVWLTDGTSTTLVVRRAWGQRGYTIGPW